MKPLVPAFSLLALVAAPAAAEERHYSITDYERVVVEGPFQVRLTTGVASSAVASGSADALEGVEIDVTDETLRIRRNVSGWSSRAAGAGGPLTIALGTRLLHSARVGGSGALSVMGMQGQRIDLNLQGTGRLQVTGLQTDRLVVGLLGSGRIEVAGHAATGQISVQGAGDMDGAHLQVDDLALAAATSGHVSVGAVRSASVTAAGLGEIEILGHPACTVSGPSAAQVRCASDQR